MAAFGRMRKSTPTPLFPLWPRTQYIEPQIIFFGWITSFGKYEARYLRYSSWGRSFDRFRLVLGEILQGLPDQCCRNRAQTQGEIKEVRLHLFQGLFIDGTLVEHLS